MGFTPGTSQSRKKKAGAYGKGLPRIEVNKIPVGGSQVIRIIQGVIQTQSIFYPAVKQDPKTGQYKLGKCLVTRPPEGCLFDALADAERKVYQRLANEGQPEYGDKSPELAPSSKWSYYALDLSKGSHDDPQVKELVANYTVFRLLSELEEMPDPQDSEYLMHGLLFMFDIVISVSQDPKKPGALGRTYSVMPYGENEWSSRVPTKHLDIEGEPLDPEVINECFTEKEMAKINAAGLDLDKLHIPHTNDEIRDMLKKNPLFLHGPRSFEPTKPAFPDVGAIEEVCEANNIPILPAQVAERYLGDGSSEVTSQGEPDPDGADDEPGAEEAEYSEVTQEEPAADPEPETNGAAEAPASGGLKPRQEKKNRPKLGQTPSKETATASSGTRPKRRW